MLSEGCGFNSLIARSLSMQEALGSNASDIHTEKHTMRHVIPMMRFTLLIKNVHGRAQHRVLRLTALRHLSLHFGGPWWASFKKGSLFLTHSLDLLCRMSHASYLILPWKVELSLENP